MKRAEPSPKSAPSPDAAPLEVIWVTKKYFDQVLDQIVARERGVLDRLEEYEPLVETYLQSVKPDGLLGYVPVTDQYFLGRLQLAGAVFFGEEFGHAHAEDIKHVGQRINRDRTLVILKLGDEPFGQI